MILIKLNDTILNIVNNKINSDNNKSKKSPIITEKFEIAKKTKKLFELQKEIVKEIDKSKVNIVEIIKKDFQSII